MRIELDDNDIREIMEEIVIDTDVYDNPIQPTDKDFKIAMAEVALDRMAKNLKEEYLKDFNNHVLGTYSILNNFARDIVRERSDEIVDKAVELVSERIIEKKKIKDEIPKASEIKTIYKDWENLFSEMVDKAIKKKFS